MVYFLFLTVYVTVSEHVYYTVTVAETNEEYIYMWSDGLVHKWAWSSYGSEITMSAPYTFLTVLSLLDRASS